MDEKEYLRKKDKIEEYKMGYIESIFTGTVLLTIGFVFFPPTSDFVLFVFFLAMSGVCIILGLRARSVGRNLGRELEGYDKERERRKAQQPIHPAAAEPTAQLQCCPSCGKRLQPDWKVCGYCGKRLKKGD